MKNHCFQNNTDTCNLEPKEELELLRLVAHNKTKRRNIPTSGILLGTLSRENSRETRFSWDTVNGHPYLRAQDFQHDIRDGSWAPVKGKCFSVRIQELAQVKGFIQQAIDMALDIPRLDTKNNHSREINNKVKQIID